MNSKHALRRWGGKLDGDLLTDHGEQVSEVSGRTGPFHRLALAFDVGQRVPLAVIRLRPHAQFRNDEDFVHVVMPMFLNGFSQ